MTESLPRIVFMGTPEFAVASLRALHNAGHCIEAVVTATDKPAGRGRKIIFSPVKEYALEHGFKILQPEKLRDPDFIAALKDLEADIFVVVAFRMLPEEVWSMPRLGTFNLHASLLPQYRGAAPINHAIINGETRTGVTTFLIDREIDTGMLLLSRETSINQDDNAGSLHDRLMKLGAALVVETAAGLGNGSLKPVPQKVNPDEIIKPAPKIFPADNVVDWKKPVVKVHNMVRGLTPSPGAATMLRKGDKVIRLKIIATRIINEITGEPATIKVKDKSRLLISCADGTIEILSLIPEGRKLMTASEFLRGFDVSGWELI
ncbi:MAG: methionyl-tRNA formyltransferase [Bacteroidales bacterium]|jgi:methionyl-tRNA formyltransferase|nr:methionyl-tRNA formyltransferase [Bacteroidales bacterium]